MDFVRNNLDTIILLSFIANVALVIICVKMYDRVDRMSAQLDHVHSFLWDDIKNKQDMSCVACGIEFYDILLNFG